MTRWGSRSLGGSHDLHVGDGRDGATDPVDQGALTAALGVALRDDGLERGRGGQDGRHVLEAALADARPVVLRERLAPTSAPAYGQDAHARRPAPLVGRRRQRGPPLRQWHPAGRRACVDEERYAVQPGRELGDGLHGAHLVVGGLAGHDRDVLEIESLEVDPGLPVDRHRPRRALGPRRGLDHRGVLDGAVDDGVAPPTGAAVQAEEAALHGRGARGREGHLVGPEPQRLGGRRPGVVEDQACRASRVVQPPRVRVRRVQRGRVGLVGGRVQRLAGGGVEVDPATVLHGAVGG